MKPGKIDLSEINSGMFWTTNRNVAKIGHSGTDPGVKKAMLSDRSKKVGVILFTNTTLS